MNEIKKTTNVVIDDLREGIYKAINESQLPISIVTLVINEIAKDIQAQEVAVLRKERNQYLAQLAESVVVKEE